MYVFRRKKAVEEIGVEQVNFLNGLAMLIAGEDEFSDMFEGCDGKKVVGEYWNDEAPQFIIEKDDGSLMRVAKSWCEEVDENKDTAEEATMYEMIDKLKKVHELDSRLSSVEHQVCKEDFEELRELLDFVEKLV